MKSNRSKFSKFLAAITLASSAISSFNGCVSGMESGVESQQKKVNNLSQEILEIIKMTQVNSFNYIFGSLSFMARVKLGVFSFYKQGITVKELLDNIKLWMEDNEYKKLTKSKIEEVLFFPLKERILKRYGEYGQERMNKYIDSIFEQVSANIPKDRLANDKTMEELADFLDKVYSQVEPERRKLAAENLKIERQKAEYERNDPKNQNINQCAICLDNASKDKKDIMIKCCKKFMHQGCYDEFLKKGGSKCPYCNQPFDKDPLNINK